MIIAATPLGKLLFYCCVFLFFSCQRSAFLTKRYVDFNFSDEGFLSPSVLQTIGRADYQSAKRGSRNDERMCLELAQRQARRRILRAMLHIRFGFGSGTRPGSRAEFEDDYPISFDASDLLQAELAFAPLLEKAFIALQDSRDRKKCMVVYRIKGKGLPQAIHRTPIGFAPQVPLR